MAATNRAGKKLIPIKDQTSIIQAQALEAFKAEQAAQQAKADDLAEVEKPAPQPVVKPAPQAKAEADVLADALDIHITARKLRGKALVIILRPEES